MEDMIYNYIYFYHLDEFCILPVYPDAITDNMQSTFNQTNALSRSAPVFTYSHSGPRDVAITLNLHRDMLNGVNMSMGNHTFKESYLSTIHGPDPDADDYVDTLIAYLQSMALPNYSVYNNTSKSVDPPMVALRLGNDVFIKGVVTSVVNVTKKKPIMSDGKYACVDITFTVQESEAYDAKTVKKVGSFRTTAAGFNINRYKTFGFTN